MLLPKAGKEVSLQTSKSAAEKQTVVLYVLFKVGKMLPVSNFRKSSDGKEVLRRKCFVIDRFFLLLPKAGLKVSLQTTKSAAEKRAVVKFVLFQVG